MTTFFRRVVNLTVAPKDSSVLARQGFDLSEVDCTFKVKKSLIGKKPNTCEVKVFNLSASTRKVLESHGTLILRLEAGYEGMVSQLFLGEVRSAHSSLRGTEIVTEIDTGDSEKEIALNKISATYGPKVPAADALRGIAKALGVGMGNVEQASARLLAKGVTTFGSGTAVLGNAARALDDFCRSADLEWSVQDGVLQILDRGAAVNEKAVLLSPETGLIGSPTVDHKGLAEATSLIQPGLAPGKKVVFDCIGFKGGYRIEKCEWDGDTRGTPWYCKMHARVY